MSVQVFELGIDRANQVELLCAPRAFELFSLAMAVPAGPVVESSEQRGQIKPRRGPSTPRHKRCVTRSIGEALRSRMTILCEL
jgi:hypothetical protein